VKGRGHLLFKPFNLLGRQKAPRYGPLAVVVQQLNTMSLGFQFDRPEVYQMAKEELLARRTSKASFGQNGSAV
jgi:hypothetical protein